MASTNTDPGTGNNVSDGASGRTPTKPAVVKAKRQLIKMTPELLVSTNGLLKLGESAAKLKFKKGPGSNAGNLHSIMQMYEAWAKNVCPPISFEEFLIKAERFGRSMVIRSVVDPLYNSVELDIQKKLGIEDSEDESADDAPIGQPQNNAANRASSEEDDDYDVREPEFSQL